MKILVSGFWFIAIVEWVLKLLGVPDSDKSAAELGSMLVEEMGWFSALKNLAGDVGKAILNRINHHILMVYNTYLW